VIGLVLAAGTGRRLRPHTEGLPKALAPLHPDAPDATPLDVILGNFAAVALTEAVVVVGHAADTIRRRVPELERRHGLALTLVHNDRADDWNNCYSLWTAREHFARGCLLSNGDTVHPPAVERTLLAAPGDGVTLAVDTVKPLAEEEMKLRWSPETGVTELTKLMDPAEAYGEYIGVSLLRPLVADALATALEETWRRDPNLYYEDGFTALSRAGHRVDVAPIGALDWVEIDDPKDLRRAQQLWKEGTCRSSPA